MNPPQYASEKSSRSTATAPVPIPQAKQQDQVNTQQSHRSSPAGSGGNKRVTDIKRISKRDSEISNASSTTSGGWRKRTIGQWQLGITVGTGGCSTVRLVRHVVTGQVGAVKIISRKMAEQVRAQSLANLIAAPDRSLQDLIAAGKAMPPPPPGLMREIAIMKLLDHPNIVRLYDVWENHNELSVVSYARLNAGLTKNSYLVMEYVQGGELFHYVEECRGLDEKETVYIFRQIIAALLYCHRLHIHHRDLKPENILLDRENAQVKLVDFGMAALQPEGKQLTTACGSPHYAAPEVIRSRPYDGAKADVWSCGVILYVMLTGTTPFNYDHERNLAVMYHAISQADYYMPPELSFQAKDLLRRIFVTRPEKRISMDEIWDHPLLHKYDKDFRYEGELARKDAWIGPMPKLDEYTVDREEDIDKEILRNMRTLWHSVPQPILIKKLLSKQPNQEKYFYAALLKHREENLENYTGGSDGLSLAASDYQHAKSAEGADGLVAPNEKQASQSSYSIMNNEHLRSSSVTEAMPSESSYDPYRPGRYPPTAGTAPSSKSIGHRRGNSAASHGSTLRVETLKKTSRQNSNARAGHVRKHSPLPSTGSHGRSLSRTSMNRASKHSLASSNWPSSPPVAVPARTVTSHKRNVSFNHVRKTSAVHAPSAAVAIPAAPAMMQAYTPELKAKALQSRQQADDERDLNSSPSTRVVTDAQARKSKAPSSVPRGRPQKQAETPNRSIKNDVRKVSTELEKACEEAFFRSSVGSSTMTSYTERQSSMDTPPSSISTIYPSTSGAPEVQRRPLPNPPTDTPNTFIVRTLEEARNKLAARTAFDDTGDTAKIKAALASLEQIMPVGLTDLEKRVTSAPEAKAVTDVGFLPIIREEQLPDTLRAGREQPQSHVHRSFTAPVPARDLTKSNGDTIRVVAPAPYNQGRLPEGSNRNVTIPYSDEIQRPRTADGTIGNSRYLQIASPREQLLRKKSHDSAIGFKVSEGNADDATMAVPEPALAKKKSAWFRRRKDSAQPPSTETETNNVVHPGIPVDLAELDDRQVLPKTSRTSMKRDKLPPQPLVLDTSTEQRPIARPQLTSTSSEFPFRRREEGESKLSKWFGKLNRSKEEEIRAVEVKGEQDSFDHRVNCTNYRSDPLPGIATSPNELPTGSPLTPVVPITPITPAENTRSWFSRFLRIRPESTVLCFAVARGRARSETYKILRDWQRHGIADLCYFPQENAISARVDKVNALGIKPVSFRVELFVVLQNGKKVGLSLARWTQTRGAASSFRRVLEVVQETLEDRDMLVTDEDKKAELQSILT